MIKLISILFFLTFLFGCNFNEDTSYVSIQDKEIQVKTLVSGPYKLDDLVALGFSIDKKFLNDNICLVYIINDSHEKIFLPIDDSIFFNSSPIYEYIKGDWHTNSVDHFFANINLAGLDPGDKSLYLFTYAPSSNRIDSVIFFFDYFQNNKIVNNMTIEDKYVVKGGMLFK